jgi:serine/threonine protein kinase
MNCLNPEILERYVSDRLNESEMSKVEQHLKQCRTCAKRVTEALENESLLSEVRSLRVKPSTTVKKESDRLAVSMSLDDAQLLLGKRYRVVKKVGSGGAGEVFQAVDAILERPVAIKFLLHKTSGDETLSARWNEARLMGQFNHANIAHLHEIGQIQGWRFIVMEWVEGIPLTQAWEPMELAQRLKTFLDVLGAVAAAHRRGIVHRDLKPSNILVTADQEVKILDFGIALAVDTPGTVERRVYRGTPAYSAPEQISNPEQISPATDVFALGNLLYQILTDTLPFSQTDTRELFKAILVKFPELPNAIKEGVPLPLQNICLKAMEKDPSKRYPDAQALADDIQRYLRGEIVWSKPSYLFEKVQQEVDTHRHKLKSWLDNDLIARSQFERLDDMYQRMVSSADPTIVEIRKLSFSQVCLYLGGWLAILGSLVLFYDAWEKIPWYWRPSPAIGAGLLMTLCGTFLWWRKETRLSIGFLATAAMLIPLAILLGLGQWKILDPSAFPWGREAMFTYHSAVLFGNGQVGVAASCWLIVSLLFLRMTRSSVFSLLAIAAFLAVLTVHFLAAGMLHWPVELIAGRYLFPAFGLFIFGMVLDRRGLGRFAWPLCSIGLAIIIAALSVIAGSEKTLFGWVNITLNFLNRPEMICLSFIGNGLVYLALATICRRMETRLQRKLAHFLTWIVPFHILIPLWVLVYEGHGHRRIYRMLLPAVSLVFVLGSVIRQRKSFFFAGLAGLAAAVAIFTQGHFKTLFAWPLALIGTGIVWMFVSWLLPRWRANRILRRAK